VTFALSETGESLSGLLEYNTDLFEAATVVRLLGHFESLVRGIGADPEQRLSELPLLSAAERQQLLVAWNETTAPYAYEQSVTELFEAQVARTPEAVAVVFGEQQLTYAELNERANQLGHHLRGLGVGPETLVGLCVERSVELVVAAGRPNGTLGTPARGDNERRLSMRHSAAKWCGRNGSRDRR